MGKPAQPHKGGGSPPPQKEIVISPKNAHLLKEKLGIDPTESSDLLLQQVSLITGSISRSPYSSADMLKQYVDAGMPEVKNRALDAIDEERRHRIRMDERQMALHETAVQATIKQQQAGQTGAWVISGVGILASILAGYIGLSIWICITIIVVAVGGPPAATTIARVLDRIITKSPSESP